MRGMRAIQMSWRERIRSRLRRNPNWVTFRRIQREGWRKALQRWRLWLQILDTPPIFTNGVDEQAPVEVHLLCCRRDYLCGIWALKSFYYLAGVRYPLVIHLQGKVSHWAVARLVSHFPMARIIPQPEANALVEGWLAERGFLRLIAARRSSPSMLKLIDFPTMSQACRLLTLDTDVLFFRYPADLLNSAEKLSQLSLFQRDLASAYNLSEKRALTDLGIELAPKVNTGIMLFTRDSLDLSRCEIYLAHPDVARPSGWIEQTLHALCASEQRRVAYLPDSYLISLEPNLHWDSLIARHYAGASRPLLTSEGINMLIQTGFLEELRDRSSTSSASRETKT